MFMILWYLIAVLVVLPFALYFVGRILLTFLAVCLFVSLIKAHRAHKAAGR